MADQFPPPPGIDPNTIAADGPPPDIVRTQIVLEVSTATGTTASITIPAATPDETARYLHWLAAWIIDDRIAAEGGHVIECTDTGAALLHPPACRPNLLDCDYERARQDFGDPGQRGRFRCTLDRGHLVLLERVPDGP